MTTYQHDDTPAPPHPWDDDHVDVDEFESFREETRESLSALAEGHNQTRADIDVITDVLALTLDSLNNIVTAVEHAQDTIERQGRRIDELEANQ